MPVLINEVIAEVSDGAAEATEAEPAPHQVPLSLVENEIAQSLALIQERRSRLKID
ncbi:MAG: hypothetical protein WC012_03655 [Thiohalomonadaceae bacterium]